MFKLQILLRQPNVARKLYQQYATSAKVANNLPPNPEKYPPKLLNKKHKTPQHLYVATEELAELIDQGIEPFMHDSKYHTAIEMNPGIGLFTEKLLSREKLQKIVAIESMDHFLPELYGLQKQNADRLLIKHADMVGLWKLTFQDKMDNGNRVDSLLEEIPQQNFNNDPNVVVFGAVGSYNFFKHLINSLVFQNSLILKGRCEMYLAVPPPIYIHLTCANDVGYMIYRSTSLLFQILFEYRYIRKLPREQFLPKQVDYNLTKSSKLKRVKSINPEYLYLVKIVPRKNVFDLCPIEDLPALWYFVKQNCVSRRNRIIPNLEKYIPGCGPRLIINQNDRQPIKQLYADENIENLPKYSVPCTTMHYNDSYPNMNIYTQFGDLRPSQMLTLFKKFRSWPEYKESSFLASLENCLLKLEASTDENIDGINITEEDDVSDLSVVEEQTLSTSNVKGIKPKITPAKG